MFSLLVTILQVSIRFPLAVVFHVISCKAFSLSSYGIFLKYSTIL